MIIVTVPGHPPGGNDLHRMSHFQVRRSREAWKNATVLSIPRIFGEPFRKASLAVTWRYRIRRVRDLDNLVAGLKPLIDGLVSGGVLEDDHSGVLVSLGPFRIEVGCERDETVLVITEEPL